MTTDTPSSRDEEIPLITAARNMDWQQVVLNGGPPCFHLCEDGRFCGRAQLWVGHDINHKFISLDDLLIRLSAEREKEGLVANRDVPTLFPTLQSEIKSLRATLAERDNQLADERLNYGAQAACIQGLENEVAMWKRRAEEKQKPVRALGENLEELTRQLLAAQTVISLLKKFRANHGLQHSGICAYRPGQLNMNCTCGCDELTDSLLASPDPTLLDEVVGILTHVINEGKGREFFERELSGETNLMFVRAVELLSRLRQSTHSGESHAD